MRNCADAARGSHRHCLYHFPILQVISDAAAARLYLGPCRFRRGPDGRARLAGEPGRSRTTEPDGPGHRAVSRRGDEITSRPARSLELVLFVRLREDNAGAFDAGRRLSVTAPGDPLALLGLSARAGDEENRAPARFHFAPPPSGRERRATREKRSRPCDRILSRAARGAPSWPRPTSLSTFPTSSGGPSGLSTSTVSIARRWRARPRSARLPAPRRWLRCAAT